MSGQVRRLSPEVRGKIAAGEVILRPLSVVKELIENALDASATVIEVDLKDGGRQKCLVNDNGTGMKRTDAERAIERYTTSKIRTIEDVERISTYGFRGEALASMAEISFFELETSDGDQGTMIVVEGGVVKRILDSERPKGTRVKVERLFYNLPVRLKFMKSAQWERKLITDMVTSYALIRPHVRFQVSEGKREILNMTSVEDILTRMRVVLATAVVDMLVPVKIDVGAVKVSGYFSRRDMQHKQRCQYININGRPIRYPRIYRAIMAAYDEPRFPPAFILDIDIEPRLVDVNIHPTKNEVKLKDEGYVIDLLTQALKHKVFFVPEAAAVSAVDGSSGSTDRPARPGTIVQEALIPYREAATAAGGPDEFWQIHNTYILAQTKTGLIIVDQHVAHERIIYESIMKESSGAQRLLFPITMDLTTNEYRIYKKTKATLKELGIEFKEFSSRTVVLDSLPADAQVNRAEIMTLFQGIDDLGNLIKEKSEVAKVVACRSAIKAGQKLSPAEMQNLIDRLFACKNPYICPHGRPIVIRFTLDELAARFGRT